MADGGPSAPQPPPVIQPVVPPTPPVQPSVPPAQLNSVSFYASIKLVTF